MVTLSGTSMPAAMSMAGQITAWNLRMSFPIGWTVAGQNLSVRSSPSRVAQGRVVVEQRVDPDVDHLRLVPRHRHAPLQPRAESERSRSPLLMNASASL